MYSLLPRDEAGNAVNGPVAALDSTGNLLWSDGTLIGVIGMHGVAVVKSGDGLLVCPMSEEQRVKELIRKFPDESFL